MFAANSCHVASSNCLPANFLGRFRQLLPPLVVRKLRPRHADDARLLRQPSFLEEQVERGNELAAGEVAGSAEDDDGVGHRGMTKLE